MADLQKRGSYTPRRAREQRAYRLALTGGVSGTVGVIALVLTIVGVGAAGGVAAIGLILAVICLVLFRRQVNL